ncbi:MAG TPA: LamG domain-containing protein [Gemmataceae bacterium]|nr:LamG domain-containing protein [Gemmataceae bacterium]
MRVARLSGVASGVIVGLIILLGPAARADLVGLYRFEDATNPGADSSPAGNNLTAFGGWGIDPNGKFGQGLSFNGFDAVLGIDDGTGVPDDNRLPNGYPFDHSSYTLAAWVNTSSLVNDGFQSQLGIIGWGFYGNAGRVIALRLKNDGNPGVTGIRHYWWSRDLDINGINLSDGTYHHIVATYDAGTMVRQIYIDGSLAGSDSPSALPNNPAASFRIGRTYDAGREYFQGTMDDVAVFNQSLTSDQILKIMGGDFSDFGVPPP